MSWSEPQSPSFVSAFQNHILRALDELDDALNLPREELERGVAMLGLGIGQVLAEVERAHIRRLPLSEAVHSHETYPYLSRLHCQLRDALLGEVPLELEPFVRSVVQLPVPDWALELRNDLCVVARSTTAGAEERALCRLLLFEGIWLNLFLAAWRTNGRFEGMGASARDVERVANDTLESLLAIPLMEDATGDAFRPYETTMCAAMVRLREHVESLWKARVMAYVRRGDAVDDLQKLCDMRAAVEISLRKADPVHAVLLRNHFERGMAKHVQPIPVERLPLEHPRILAGKNKNSLDQQLARAKTILRKNSRGLARHNTRVLADLLTAQEPTNA
jgi:hypothetical protein